MKIRNIVRQQEGAAFRNDVQLRWYASSGTENLTLARNYMFTRKSVGQRKSPIDILYQLRQAFLTDTFENRFMVIATYGHGKSHLALALANYFGKSVDSDECKAILSSITHAFGGQAEAQNYVDFKQSKKRMLVVCLEGTRPGDLAQQFLQALRTALKSEPETQKQHLPFWTREAVRLMESIASKEQESAKANAFLRDRGMDVASLLEALRGQDTEVYEIVRDLVSHVRGVIPDLGGPVSLAHAVEWAADTFCGMEDSKPFGGILILFDEFSAFLRNYSRRVTPGNPLQDLLDGVSNRKGKVVFVAFGQLEPTATIGSVFSLSPNDAAREAMLVELTRLPPAYHYQLYTTMEDVLDTYLWQDQEGLNREFEDGRAWPAVFEATDNCLLIFQRHYERDLGWDSEQFQKRVTLGAYPLHPMTTALLCNIELLESANPRSILGFVFEELAAVAESPVVVNQVPTWINSTRLVDQFGEQLADEEYKQYSEAVRQRGGDLTPDEASVLKAMLLHSVGRMPTHLVVYSKSISSMCGLTTERAEEVLQSLARLGIVEQQVAQGKYTFWSVGGGARRLHEHVNNAIAGRNLSWTDLSTVNKDGRAFEHPALPVSVSWGHQNDWQAEQLYLTRGFTTNDKIRELMSKARGVVIWLVAATDEDVNWFEKNAQAVLDAAAGDPAAPVVLMVPTAPRPALLTAFQKYCVLQKLSPAEITDYGGGTVQSVKAQVGATIKEDTQAIESTMKRALVPRLFSAAFNAGPALHRPDDIIRKAYELSFTSAPPAFFDQYKLSSGQLRTAVKLVGKHMLENNLTDITPGANPTADLMLRKFILQGEATSWGIASLERRLQEPASERTRKAWDKLDTCVPTNGAEIPIREVIKALQAPPFGYDPNTLCLLFCAWFGYHRLTMRLTVNGIVTQRAELATRLDAGPAELVEFLTTGQVSLQRQDRSQKKAETQVLVERIQRMGSQPLSRSEATAALGKLDEFLQDEANEDPTERQEITESRNALDAALERASSYDGGVRALRAEVQSTSDIPQVVALVARLSSLPLPGGVQAEEPRLDVVRKELRDRLAVIVKGLCESCSSLPDLTHYQDKKRSLENALSALPDHLDLKQSVTQALSALEKSKLELERQQQDQTTIAVLNTMQPTGTLVQLRSWFECASANTCHSDMARKLQKEKVAALQTSIRKMEQFVASLSDRLDKIKTTADAQSTNQAIAQTRAMYAETPEEATLDAVLGRCAQIAALFSEMDAVEREIAQLRDRGEIAAIEKQLAEALDRASNVLCSSQKDLVAQRSQSLKTRVEKLEKEAVAWLDQISSRVARADDLESALRALNAPPSFLPEAKHGELQGLATTAQRKMDEDSRGQVIRYFNRITDKAEQQKLLEELRKMSQSS